VSPAPEIHMRRRIEAVAGVMALGFALLLIRAIDLQWFQAQKLKQLAKNQRQREFIVAAPRGAIVDHRGRILAESVRVPSISAIGREVPAAKVPQLAAALGMDPALLRHRLQRHPGFVWLARQLNPAAARKVAALEIPGVHQVMEWRRYQPLGPATGQLLGFVGVDGKGLEGLEYSLDTRLAGAPGRMLVQYDARGHSLPGARWLVRPVAGKRVRLLIDATIQSLAYAALAEGVRRSGARAGSIVVMRPQDGAVLAMANWPSFNPNDYHRYHPRQWRNRAVTDVFEPGSVLKPFTIVAALLSGRWRPASRVFCEQGRFRVADYVIHDDHAEGWLDLTGLLARSSNICAAKLALDIGPGPLRRLLLRVGFGQRTGIGISGESPGILPPLQRWGPVETATIAFGQGVAITPLQLATAFCTLANGGLRVRPRIIHGGGHDLPRRVIPSQVAHEVLRMLVHAAGPEGTGALSVPSGYTVAGKTGTAQKPDGHGGYAGGRFTAVFAGAVPARAPRLVIAVVVDEPHGSIYGGKVAAPIFRHLAAQVLPYLGVPPRQPPTPLQPVFASGASMHPKAMSVDAAPSLYGWSLREVARLAARKGYRLRVHGGGWVIRQKPAALSHLAAGGTLEVWLHE